jgi:hypothetical protein
MSKYSEGLIILACALTFWLIWQKFLKLVGYTEPVMLTDSSDEPRLSWGSGVNQWTDDFLQLVPESSSHLFNRLQFCILYCVNYNQP